MGLFDDLLPPLPGAAPQPTRLGLFDDLLPPIDDWRAHALPTAKIDELHNLPREGGPGALGPALRIVGSEMIGGLPRVAGLVDTATDWLSRPPEGPDDLLGAARLGLASSPVGLGLRAGKALRDAAGVTGGVETANEAIDALQEQEREKLLALDADPNVGPFVEYGARITGALADPLNFIGTRTLARGGQAVAEALPETWSPLKKFLLQDLVGGGERATAGAAPAIERTAADLVPPPTEVPPAALGPDLPPGVPPPTTRVDRDPFFARAAEKARELDLAPDLVAANQRIAELPKGSVKAYLETTATTGDDLTPESQRLVEFIDTNKGDKFALAGVQRQYDNLLAAVPPGAPPPPKAALLDEALRTWKASEEPLLFPGGATGIVAGLADVLPAPLGAIARHLDLSKLAATARRWLSNFGDVDALGKIAPEVAERIRLSVADRAAHEARATMDLRDYEVALKAFQRELGDSKIIRTDDEIAQEVLAGLLGESDLSGLSPALQDVAVRMRGHVDELTGGILQNQPLTKELRYTLEQNLGAYLRKTYEIHRDPTAWKKVVREQEPWRWEGAKRWVGEQHPQWTDDQIEGYLNSYFERQPDAATAIAPRSDVFRIEKGLFKHRIRQHLAHIEGEPTRAYPTKEAANKAAGELRGLGKKVTVVEEEGLPKELEDFLGLHTDPRTRYAESVARMAHDLSTARLLGDIRALGEQSIFFPEATGEFAAQIAGDPRFNPLAGMHTTGEVRAVLEALQRPNAAPEWLQKVMAANATVRAGKTVGSPLTHVRNFLSWNFMLLSNGHFSSMVNVPRLWRAAKVVGASKLSMQGRVHRGIEGLADALETVGGEKLSSVFRFDLPSLRKEYERGVRLGIIGDGRGQELARWLGQAQASETIQKLGETRIGKGAGWVAGKARELYSGEDDIGKVVAWLGERANYQFAFPEMSADEIAELTAPLVRDLYPTYSKASTAVRAVRDFPLFGDFPTFWAEIIRTSKNTLKRGAWELAQIKTNPRLAAIGAKRLAGYGSAIAASAGIAATLRARLGISAEEMESAREFAPEWNRNADLVPVEKKGEGQYSVIDLSYINPYAMFRESWNALTANGYRWDERIGGMLDELRAPFTNEGILAGLYTDLQRNRDKFGRKIWPEFGTWAEKAEAISKYAGVRLQPGVVSQVQDLSAAATGGENPRTGRTVDPETLAWSWLTGTRQLEIDVPKRLAGGVRGLQRARSEIVGEWNRAKLDSTGPTPELLEKKASSNAQWKEALRQYRRQIEAARATGLSDYQIRKILTDAEIGSPTIDALMGGYDFEVAK